MEASKIVNTWLLTDNVNEATQCTGITYAVLLFTTAKALNNNWFTVAGLPQFIWNKWTLPCTNIEGVELSWEWYLRVQDVFFHNMLETYYECLKENFVILNGMAYPINSIIPKSVAAAARDAESNGDASVNIIVPKKGATARDIDSDGDIRMDDGDSERLAGQSRRKPSYGMLLC
jgi:hypothetical protein